MSFAYMVFTTINFKKIVFLSSVCFLVSGKAGAQLSYDFAQPLPPESKQVNAVAKSYFGKYSSDSVDIDYEFTSEGVYAVSTVFSSISRETIRESSRYRVENGYIFGVNGEDSLPCVLQGEYYHFAIHFRELIAGGDSKNVLTKVNESTYILNFEDKGHFTPSLFEFKGKQLTVRHFTYDEATEVFNDIDARSERPYNELTYVTLQPTLAEWNALPQDGILTEAVLFKR